MVPDRCQILRVGDGSDRVGVIVNDERGMGLAQVTPEIPPGEFQYPPH